MKRSYSSGMAFALASFGSIGVATLATSILTARIYGVTVVGEAALALAPVAIVTLLSTVREQPAMVRKIAALPPRDPLVTGIWLAVFCFSFVLTAAVAAVGVLACWLVFHGPIDQPELFAPAAAALVGYLLVINTCWNVDGAFGAFRAGRELFAVRLHQALAYAALVVALSFVSHSVWSLTLAFLLSWTTALAHRLALVGRVMRWRVERAQIRAGFATLREIVTFGLKITPGSIANGLSDSSGTSRARSRPSAPTAAPRTSPRGWASSTGASRRCCCRRSWSAARPATPRAATASSATRCATRPSGCCCRPPSAPAPRSP
jgi:O-antigen/teichoic acid export membrane protein